MVQISKSYILEQLNGCSQALIPNLHFNSELLLLLNPNLFNNICGTSLSQLPGPRELGQNPEWDEWSQGSLCCWC